MVYVGERVRALFSGAEATGGGVLWGRLRARRDMIEGICMSGVLGSNLYERGDFRGGLRAGFVWIVIYGAQVHINLRTQRTILKALLSSLTSQRATF